MGCRWKRRVVSCCAGLSLMALAGCTRVERDVHEESPDLSARPPDSLTLTGKNLEIWLTLARTGRAPDHTSCVERGLEIRREGKRIPVPLLYTGEAPILLNDSTMRAMLWTNCRPVATYRVDLRTGRPVREPAKGQP